MSGAWLPAGASGAQSLHFKETGQLPEPVAFMIFQRKLTINSIVPVILAGALTACTPGYINTENVWTAATTEEIHAYFAGNSFPNATGNRAFFGKDGAINFLDGDQLALSHRRCITRWKPPPCAKN